MVFFIASHTPRNDEEYQELLTLLRTNDGSVKGVDMQFYHPAHPNGRARLLGEALLENSTSFYLSLDVVALFPDSFSSAAALLNEFAPLLEYVTSNQALKDLRLMFDTTVTMTNLSKQLAIAFANAVGANRFLKNLYLGWHGRRGDDGSGGGGSVDMVTQFLLNLGDRPTFNDLMFMATNPEDTSIEQRQHHFEALERFALSTNGAPKVSFTGYYFNGEGAGTCLLAMAAWPGKKSFSFSGTRFDSEAAGSFVSFVKSIDMNEGNPQSTLTVSGRMEFESMTTGMVLAEGLVDSKLSKFYLHRGPNSDVDTTEMFNGLCGKQTHLRELILDSLNVSEANALARFLPTTARLVLLVVASVDETVMRKPVLKTIRKGIRCNGSLVGTTFFRGRRSAIGHILSRNIAMPKMLARPILPDSDETEGKTDLELFPTLFCSAFAAPAMAPNSALIGLVAAAVAISGQPPVPAPQSSSSTERSE